jgi:cyclic pyranopterin phosphate synthase
MVDVGHKDVTERSATAEGWIRMTPATFALVQQRTGRKGDVCRLAEVAGVMGAKQTSQLIPLTHPLGLDHVSVEADLDGELPGIRVRARAATVARTGVEMEALTAVAVALLTAYDMVKSAGHELDIGGVRLLEKSGGASGDYARDTHHEAP